MIRGIRSANGNMMNILDNGIHLAQTMSFEQLDRCLDLITYNGAKTLNVVDQYGIEEGKPANFLVLDAYTPFEAVRQRAGVLASIRNGEYLFKRPEPSYEVEIDLFRRLSERQDSTRAHSLSESPAEVYERYLGSSTLPAQSPEKGSRPGGRHRLSINTEWWGPWIGAQEAWGSSNSPLSQSG